MKPIKFEAYRENKDAENLTNEGKIAIGYFFGQTIIHMPLNVYQQLGNDKISSAIEKIFTTKRLIKFRGGGDIFLRKGLLAGIVDSHYEVEVPSVLEYAGFGKEPLWDVDEKIPRLIKLLNQELSKS